MISTPKERHNVKRKTLLGLGLLLAVVCTACSATPQPGQIGVKRSGKNVLVPWTWGHSHKITGVVMPASGFTITGFGTAVHWYPADTVQRNYTITSESGEGDRKGADVVEVPTQDGVRAGIEGTFYFTTAFGETPKGSSKEPIVEDFDERFGIRTFKEDSESEALKPYEGENGWRAFLAQVIRPIINNDLRRSIANVSCAELVSSCALVHNQGNVNSVAHTNNNANIQKVQEEINATLKEDVAHTLGHDYFSKISFLLEHVALPGQIQTEIDHAQATFASVGAAIAQVEKAKQEAKANEEKQRGYSHCPACAQIDELKAIPPSVTTFAPGSGFAVTTK